jgi:hypothetical protein
MAAAGQSVAASVLDELFPEFPGYRIEKLPEDPGKISFAYKIIGPKKEFYLLRNQPNPAMLFVCPEGRRTSKIRGYSWFKEVDGKLHPAK